MNEANKGVQGTAHKVRCPLTPDVGCQRMIMRKQTSVFHAFDAALFSTDRSAVQGRIRTSVLLTLFVVGVVHWVGFFHAANLTAYDWPKEVAYLDTLRNSISTGVIPWCWSEEFYHGTQNFLGIPEVKLTPDVLILPLVSNPTFVLIHVLIFYSVGFWFCVRLAKDLAASTAAFFLFWLLFNFNGYITAHLAVGHFQWTGYFLLPAFFVQLFRLVAAPPASDIGSKTVLNMLLLLGMLFLNGSLHIAIWCCMFLAAAALSQPLLLKHVAIAITGGGLLGAVRLLPAAFSFGESYKPFISGYPSLAVLLDAFTTLRRHCAERVGGIWGEIGWWEYDIFIGFVAVVILAVVVVSAIRMRDLRNITPILVAACTLLLFSLGNAYGLIAKAPIPFAGVERVSSRFIILPFITMLVIGMQGVDELLHRFPRPTRMMILISTPFMAFEMALHSMLWRVARIEWSALATYPPTLSLIPNQDQLYAASVLAGSTVSLLSICVVVFVYLRIKRNAVLENEKTRTPNKAIDSDEE